MWPNDRFENNGSNFNLHNYLPSPFAGHPGQQYFPQIPFQPNTMQLEGDSGEASINGEFQPDIGLYNEGTFAQNHLANSANAQFSPPHLNKVPTANTPTPLRPITNISTRAAELKAQLLKGRQRANSATPPVGMVGKPGKQQPSASDGSSSFRGSPQTPATATDTSEQELNINELISQYADPKPAADTQMKDYNNNLPTLSQGSSLPEPPVKSQVPSLGSLTKVTKPHNDKTIGNGFNTKNLESRNASSGSVSEGEIFEDPAAKKALPATEPRDAKSIAKAINKEEPAPRKPRDEQRFKTSSAPGDSSPRRALPSNLKPRTPRYVENRRDEADPRQDRRPYPSNYTNEQRPHPSDSDRSRSPQQRRDMRDQNEDHLRLQIQSERHEDTSRPHREAKPPILDELLPYDDDLREWLEITGYHNKPYRGKILNRRRAIAQLDAQRNALLAEMEAEERGGIPAVNGIPITSTTVLPPPMPNKLGDRAEAFPLPTNATPEIQHDRVVSNKRSHSEVQDIRDDSSAKFARTNDHGPRVKQEDNDYGRPRSSGHDTSRRRSFDDRLDDRDASRAHYEESRGRGRSDSREHDVSPARKAYEGRPPLRSRGYESGDDFHMRDRDDREDRGRDRSGRLERPFVVRGGYRGRAFDPNYRGRGGRGGGRGRGDYQSHIEPKSERGAFSVKFANSKPYKDTRGFERGGRGETRYFIVKSFNEENVMKCIEDGVWTTQLQNGPLFKEAFESCKNVILVFSINKSRAFQGYARMESRPGSVEIPPWQRAIKWESAGAFKVKWLVICATRFHRIGHLKNALNDNQAVLIGKDGQEIEENCGSGLIELIDEEVDQALAADWKHPKRDPGDWDE